MKLYSNYIKVGLLSKVIGSLNTDIIITIMLSQGEKPVSKCSIFFLLILSISISAAAVTLIIFLAVWGNIGFLGSGSITVSACSANYYSAKFGNIGLVNEIVFIFSCFATFNSFIFLFMMIGWVVRSCRDILIISNCQKGSLFFLLTLTILAAIVPSGHYLSILIEISKCTATFDSTQIISIIFVAAVVLLLSFLSLLAILCTDSSRQEKYRQINTNQTQPSQLKKEEAIPRRQDPIKTKQEDYTRQKLISRQNVYDSPYKRRIQREKQPIYLQKKDYFRKEEEDIPEYPILPTNNRSPNRGQNRYQNRQQNVVQNLHPNFRNIDPVKYVEASKRNYQYEREQQNKFMREQQKKYEQDHRGILSRGEYEQRDRNRYESHRNDFQPRNRDRRQQYPRSFERGGRDRDDRFEDEYNYNNRHPSPNQYQNREGIMKNFRNRY